jgi:UDP-2,4-diacetamido-2,4,6-trideoxy-beta-L-altropyranose hydrolase
MARPRILVFPDGGPDIGGGHILRGLTLAQALADQGATIAFAANAAARGVIAAYGAGAYPVVPLPDDLGEAVQAAARVAADFAADWVLLDHYRVNADQEAVLRAGRRLAVLDDLADRPRPADLWLNPGYGAQAADYAGLAPAGAQVLAGPAYAPVRSAFAALREPALARRAQDAPPTRALVFLGMGDLDGVTARIARAVRAAFPALALDVVVGAGARSLPVLRNIDGLNLHVDTPDMAALCARADIAVGAGGSAVWERAVLGLPAVTVVLADNQRPMAQAMARGGLTLALDVADARFDAELIEATRRLVEDDALRQTMSRALMALCDGQGAARFAGALLGFGAPP